MTVDVRVDRPAGGRWWRRWPAAAWSALRPHLPALAVLALIALLYLWALDSWLINDDEEGYLYAAWRISQGELPYRDFLTPQLPGFLFPGALWVRLLGREALVLRAWSVALTLVAGAATYLTGRRLLGPTGGLTAALGLLIIDDVFAVGRVFRPEAAMLAYSTLALYTFVRADERRLRLGYALAGLLCGLALLTKLFGLLPLAAFAAYLGFDVVRGRRAVGAAAADVAALVAPAVLLVAGVMGGFMLLTPRTYEAVLGHHLMQGAGLSRSEIIGKTLGFYWRALNWHAPFLALVPAGWLALRRRAPARGPVLVWWLLTVGGFFFLSRTLFARHLVYVLPALMLTVGAAVALLDDGLRRALPGARLERGVLVGGVVAALLLPHALENVQSLGRREIGTARLAALARALVPPGAGVVADYPGIGFYAGRPTTYSGAGLSEGAAESGQITGARLLEEMAALDVPLVLVDTHSQGGHLVDLQDWDAFRAALEADYVELGHFLRYHQPNQVFLRRDQPTLGLDYGWAELVAATPEDTEVPAGATLEVVLVLRTVAPPSEMYTAFLHLDDATGTTWGQGDRLLTNALHRSTEEWQANEVVAVPLTLEVPPGTPPGRYTLRAGLYERESGQRLRFEREDGAGTDFTMAEVEVTPPAQPGAVDVDALPGEPVDDVPADDGASPYTLLAVEAPDAVRAGFPLAARLSWRAVRAPEGVHRMRLELFGPQGDDWGTTTVTPGGATWPTAAWRRGEVVTVRAVLPVSPLAGPGRAALGATWIDSGGSPLGSAVTAAATITVEPLPPPEPDPPPLPIALEARLGDDRRGPALRLTGAALPATATTGATVPLTLAWRAEEIAARPYTVLTHVVDDDGDIVAQADGPPAGGARPTTSWRPGETIVDRREVRLPSDLAAGRYDVLVGLYDAAAPGYPRLPVEIDGATREDGRVPVGTIDVGR